MINTSLTLPIFPLPVFLLPEGITRLRIFEPRYLKMVKMASQGQGFVILFNNKNVETPDIHWGSWVEIINFNQGKDGVLEIDVKCKSLVEVRAVVKDSQNLHFGEVNKISHWSQGPFLESPTLSDSIIITLANVFENNDILKELYADIPKQNVAWVIARWLELLPLPQTIKNTFIVEHSFIEARKFVESIIQQEKNK